MKVQIASSYKRLSTVFVGTDISLVVLVMAPNMQLESSICIVLLPTVRMMTHIRIRLSNVDPLMLPKMLHIIERLPTVRIIADIVLTALRIVDMKMRCQIALPRECFVTARVWTVIWFLALRFCRLSFYGCYTILKHLLFSEECLSRCREDLYRLIHQIEGFFHIPIVRLKQQLRDLCFTHSSPSLGLYFAPEMPFSTRESSCNLHFQ